jgi:tripartite-type tricarboxylate transporter receptor subunit TctC
MRRLLMGGSLTGIGMDVSRRRILQLAGAAAIGSYAPAALAQDYPNRVVRLLVGFPPGGGADLATRVVSEGLSDKWKQQTIVENKPGAGARLAMDATTKAAPDGYTLLVAPGSPEVNRFLFSTLTFDPVADLAPISLIGTYPNIIAVANNSPFN